MRKFQREMRKLGLGVSIKAGDSEWVVVTEPPETLHIDGCVLPGDHEGDCVLSDDQRSRREA